MSSHFERARLLYGQSRYELAERELGLAMIEDAQQAGAHALLALCLLQREQFDAATSEAAESIRLAPDSDFCHSVSAQVWLKRNHLVEAETAARECITIDPYDEHWHTLLGTILLRQERWTEALESADEGLELNPESVHALNLRAALLRQLGRPEEASAALAAALAQRPGEAWTHANLGWSSLSEGDAESAERSFREALRLDPECEAARAGVVEAIKSKNPIYRWIFGAFFWVGRQTTTRQWQIFVGGFLGYQVVLSLAKSYPQYGPVLWPILGAYISLVLLSWFTTPISNLLLRLHPLGKLSLSKRERLGANWVGALLITGIVGMLLGLTLEIGVLMIVGVDLVLLAIPVAMTADCAEPQPRRWMLYYTGTLAVLGLIFAGFYIAIFSLTDETILRICGGPLRFARLFASVQSIGQVYLWGCVLSVWGVNIFKSMAWKR